MSVVRVHWSQQGCLLVDSVVDYVEVVGLRRRCYSDILFSHAYRGFRGSCLSLPLETYAYLSNAFCASEVPSISVRNLQ